MTARSLRPKRRMRHMVVATAALTVSAVGLWLLAWTQLESNSRAAWISASEKLGIDVDFTIDKTDSSTLGQVRTWFGISKVNVYLSRDADAVRLLRAPAGEPHPMVIHLAGHVSDESLDRIAVRFPNAELRTPPGGLGGMGGMDSQGFF